jgi:hypothetical protein
MKNSIILPMVFCAALLLRCDPEPTLKPTVVAIKDEDKDLPARWADVTLATIKSSFPNSPTFTSRNLGYIGVTMYECVVHGSADHKSLVGQLNGLTTLPVPATGLEYNWHLSLNAGQAEILRLLYAHSYSPEIIGALEEQTLSQFESVDPEIKLRSIEFGKAIAQAIFEWSKTDGGHEGHLRNFDYSYVVPAGNGYWTAPFAGQTVSTVPLHPYWGQNRTFVPDNATLPVPKMTAHSPLPNSPYHNLFKAVYLKRNSLTEEEKRVAAWWADDPTQSASPPGHSYNLATIAVTSGKSDIFTAAETYAKVGMAVADAFICCWKAKYTYHSERPAPYIRAYIDKDYQQFWPEPPFPAFPSGHATQSAAAAISMISVFGNDFPFVDNTYENRQPDFQNITYQSRTFQNIWDTAEECAHSRFLGGIHTNQDNEQGQLQGKKIGENVLELEWRK